MHQANVDGDEARVNKITNWTIDDAGMRYPVFDYKGLSLAISTKDNIINSTIMVIWFIVFFSAALFKFMRYIP